MANRPRSALYTDVHLRVGGAQPANGRSPPGSFQPEGGHHARRATRWPKSSSRPTSCFRCRAGAAAPSPNGGNGHRRRRDTVTKRVVTVNGGESPRSQTPVWERAPPNLPFRPGWGETEFRGPPFPNGSLGTREPENLRDRGERHRARRA